MIFNQQLDYDKINIKIKQDFTNGYTFVPIKYDNEDIVIQTPKLFIPFNINILLLPILCKYIQCIPIKPIIII